MKTLDYAKKGLYVGTGAGIILFALVGLLPGSFVGGFIGLKLSEAIFGAAMAGTVLARVLVAVSMLVGVMVSAVTFIFGAGVMGWAAGTALESLKRAKEVATPATESVRS
jgi:hypothetical protein